MYPFYTNFASGSVASTKFNYNGVKEWNLIPRKKGEKPIVLKIVIIIIISSLTGNYSVAQGVHLLIHTDRQLLKFMLPIELSSSAGIFFIWPDAKFPVAVIFDLGNRERLGRVKVETVPFD